MKLSLGRQTTGIVTVALAGALTLGAGGMALAQQAAPAPQADASSPHRGHHEGIVAQALGLSSLTAEQRTAIAKLADARRAAEVPVKQADAQLLTALAKQVEQAAIDRQALAPDLQARDTAATAARTVDRDTLQQLHDVLTPAQRGQLVDAIEAQGHGWDGRGRREHLAHMEQRLGLSEQQEAQIAANLHAGRQPPPDGGHHGPGEGRQAWLESFRTASFNASAAGPHGGGHPGEHLENLMQAMVPVLSPSQRSELATHLRHRAAHESRS
jgi:Spy/CpxP family protein refolding chaperone